MTHPNSHGSDGLDAASANHRLLPTIVALLYAFVLMIGVGLPIGPHDSLDLAMDARLMHRDLRLERTGSSGSTLQGPTKASDMSLRYTLSPNINKSAEPGERGSPPSVRGSR